MSELKFPEFDGYDWNTVVKPMFNTSIFVSDAGNEVRFAKQVHPKYSIKFSFEHLVANKKKNELLSLWGFIVSMKGSYDSFYFKLKDDNTADKIFFVTGNGTTDTAYLYKKVGPNFEFVQSLVENLVIEDQDGTILVEGTDFTVGDKNLITFTTAPSIGTKLYWSGTYYYKVRFANDYVELINTSRGIYECQDIELIGSLRDMI